VQQGGVKVGGEVVRDLEVARSSLEGAVLQVGKRRFLRLSG
jgi:tyrosyl-tRNA synthetase